MNFISIIWNCSDFISRAWNKLIVSPMKRSLFRACGEEVIIARRVKADGWNNISVGNHVSIGEDCRFMTTRANIVIGDHVMFAPDVTVITGGHKTDIKGRYMDEIRESEKCPQDDQDVVFEGDNWIGAGAIILKGVFVGKGAVIAAGAIVTKSIEPYTIVGGRAAQEIGKRFLR